LSKIRVLKFDEETDPVITFIKIDTNVVFMIIREVRDRGDGVKQITIPKDSEIKPGDYVKIKKVEDH